MAACNLCGNDTFQTYRGRSLEQCTNCLSKARHRVGWNVYERMLFPLLASRKFPRVLHLAPEAGLHDKLQLQIGDGYLPADAAPERYARASCMRLFFPDDFKVFTDGYFDAVLHNHVLEHIPGHYRDHLIEFTRLLKPGGRMIFSVPGPYKGQSTVEGGEHLASDAERLAKFKQEDHFKLFGDDFVDTLDDLSGGLLLEDGVTDEIRSQLSVRPGKAPFFIWERSADQ